MTPVNWVHEWWLYEDCWTDQDEGQQVCRKIAEIDALWSYGERAGGDRLEYGASSDSTAMTQTDPTQRIADAFLR